MTGKSAPLLQGRHIGRRHPDGRRWLLEDVSIEIHPRTWLAVAGPSGSGKTLLLRALALLDPLDTGEVRFKGRPVPRDEVPNFRRATIYLHQRPALLEEDVEAALRRPFSLAAHRRRLFDIRRITGLLTQLGREQSFLAKRCADLSGGERQIVAVLRAVQLDPTVLLLDEPTAALDAPTARTVEELLRHWVRNSTEGRAMIWVTHDAQQARRAAGRASFLEGGRMKQQ